MEILLTRFFDIRNSARFSQKKLFSFVFVSAAIISPCFWQKHIEAGDLGSHTYNAWLVHLIRQGRAPGLWVKSIWQNILFDWVLSGLCSVLGFHWGEKVAVALVVLIFFWSAFAFISAVSGTVSWTLLPALAMLTYGWTFQAGFFNFYLAIGLSFLAISIFWTTHGWRRLYALLLAPLIFLAHPLGLIWFLAVALYVLIYERITAQYRAHLPAVAGLVLIIAHKFIWHHFRVAGSLRPVYTLIGPDQLVIYGNRYKLLAGSVFLFVSLWLLWDVLVCMKKGVRAATRLWLPLQLFVVIELGVFLLPDLIFLPRQPAPISLLLERLTLISAVLILAVLSTLQTQIWQFVGFCLFAAVFFLFLYQDTAKISAMETCAEQLVSELPSGARVMATIRKPPGTPIYFIDHFADRACIERCFSFGNYEAPSQAFRVRALPGNGIITASPQDSGDIENGSYLVKPQDLPAYQIYQCPPFSTDLCIRKLEAGEKNDPVASNP